MATYPQWCCSMDVTDDMRYVAINDDDEIIYCIDREDHNKVRYMLDKRDFRVEYARPDEIINKTARLSDEEYAVIKRHPEIARIIGVADAYDAMTSNRSYRNAMSQEKVRSEIEKGKGSQFDPVFADIMLEVDEDIKTEIYG